MFDLNLLRVLAAVIEQGTVTAAAEKLELTQPAITHALNRMRKHTQDEVFIKEGRRVVATRAAMQLYHDTAELVRASEAAVERVAAFDPATTTATFRIALTDIGQQMFLPLLVSALHRCAPHAQLEVEPPKRDSIAALLASGELDLSILSSDLGPTVRSEKLSYDRYVCVARRGTFGASGPTREDVSTTPRVVISSITGHTLVERELPPAPPGSIRTESFGGIPSLLVGSDLIAFVPDALSSSWGQRWDIERWLAPVEHARVQVRAHLPLQPRSRASSWFGNFAVEVLRDPDLVSGGL